MRQLILAALYLPPGKTTEQYLLPPYSTTEIVRAAIFQIQIVIGDLIMVCLQPPRLRTVWSLTVSKIYRMYHIFDKSLLACLIPAITTAGLICDLSPHSSRPPVF